MISSGIAIFSDVSKRCNILLSQYIAIQNAQPWSCCVLDQPGSDNTGPTEQRSQAAPHPGKCQINQQNLQVASSDLSKGPHPNSFFSYLVNSSLYEAFSDVSCWDCQNLSFLLTLTETVKIILDLFLLKKYF